MVKKEVSQKPKNNMKKYYKPEDYREVDSRPHAATVTLLLIATLTAVFLFAQFVMPIQG